MSAPTTAFDNVGFDPFNVVFLSSEKYPARNLRFDPTVIRKCNTAGLVISYSDHGYGLFTGSTGINQNSTIITLGLPGDSIIGTSTLRKLLRPEVSSGRNSNSSNRITGGAADLTSKRHIHEFVGLGEVPKSLKGKNVDKLRWVDLVEAKSPALFINHVREAESNVAFLACQRDNSDLTYVVALRPIPPYTELLCSYMDHLDSVVQNK